MAQPTAKHLARLARVARDLEQKRTLLATLQGRLEVVQRARVIADGESWMLDQLEGHLRQALQMLDTLQEAERTQEATEQLAELEEVLEDPEWDLSDQIMNDLIKKENAINQMISDAEDQIAEWQAHIDALEAELAEARKHRAPVIRQEAEVFRLEAIVKQADRALRDQQFGLLTESFAQLEEQKDRPEELIAEISERTARAKQFSMQADLLLLRSPMIDDQRYEYTVLLRTPSEVGTHGINVQDLSPLAKQDRKRMTAAIEQVTDAINSGLARSFELRSQSRAQQEAEGVSPGAGGEEGGEPEGPALATRDLLLGGTGDQGWGPLVVNELAEDVGDLMYSLFMPEQMRRYLKDRSCSITITTNDLELPWELMWTGETFLCLERPVARMPMGQAFPLAPPQVVRAGRGLRFLLIYADPDENLPAAGREVERIKAGLEQEWKDEIEIEILKREDARGHKLNEVLRDGSYDVIHFAGHAAFDEEHPELSGLLLHDGEILFAQKVRRLLRGRPLVFLNACQTGRTANEEEAQQIRKYLQKPAEGLASSFIYGGALGCIGALWPIYDRPAAEFAVEFYNRVLEGHMIGEAMWLARTHIWEAHPDQITWAAFVLYGDPTFRLVD